MKFWTLVLLGVLIPSSVLATCGPSQITLTDASPQYVLESEQPHPSPVQCDWDISAPGPITVDCNMIDLSCKNSYLGIYLNGVVNQYCGTESFTTETNNNSVKVTFTSKRKNIKFGGYRCVISYTSTRTLVTTMSSSPNSQTPKPPPCQCGKRGQTRIVGGVEATQYNYRWQAMLLAYTNFHFCGGFIIHEKWILTAAHCTDNFKANEIRVRVGEHDKTKIEGYEQTYYIKQIIEHEHFDRGYLDNDIALLELNQTISLNSRVAPVCLPFQPQDVDGKIGTVTGWGTTAETGPTSNILMKVDIPLLSTEACKKYLGTGINNNMICTYEPGKDSCRGDSGGPLVWENSAGNNILVGIVSWGYGCGRENSPGAYTKVWNYIEWINSKTGIIGELCDASGI